MELTDWVDRENRKSKKASGKKAIRHVEELALDEEIEDPSPRVKGIETDGGKVIVWRRSSSSIIRLFVPLPGEIMVRGEERWPRGLTPRYDSLCQIIEAQLNGRKEFADKLLRKFLDNGPIATERAEREANPPKPKFRKRNRLRLR